MPEPRQPGQPLRRVDDGRFEDFIERFNRIERKVDDLHEVLADPDKTVLGKTLIGRANTNAANIERHEGRIDRLESWQDQMKGSLAAARVTQIILGIIVGLLTIAAMNGRLPHG